MICSECRRQIPPWEHHHLRTAGMSFDDKPYPLYRVLCIGCVAEEEGRRE